MPLLRFQSRACGGPSAHRSTRTCCAALPTTSSGGADACGPRRTWGRSRRIGAPAADRRRAPAPGPRRLPRHAGGLGDCPGL